MNRAVPNLTNQHPSFGVRQATFLYALDGEDGVRRFLAVPAARSEAVAVLERLSYSDGRVSESCRLVGTFPGCANAGVRDPLMESIPYADFVTDVVDPDRLLNDPSTAALFQTSLTEGERSHIVQKLQSQVAAAGASPEFRKVPAKEDEWGDWKPAPKRSFKKPPVESIIVQAPKDDDKVQKVVLSLQGLGFKKADIQEYVRSVSSRMEEPLPVLIRDGIRKLT